MVEEGRPSIIGEIEQERRLKAAHEASVQEAEKAVPAFKDRLGVLIRTHIAPPQETYVDFWDHINLNRGRGKVSYPTTLNAKVNSAQGIIEVNISATSYPSQDGDSSGRPNKTDYKVDVQDLDHYLLIRGGKGFLESKGKQSDMPIDREHVVIGKKYNSWPSWRRPADMAELKRYIELLDILEAGDVQLSGFTPDIKKIKTQGSSASTTLDTL